MAYVGRFGALARSIGVASEKAKPKNTKKAYNPKKHEFMQYCDSVFGEETNPRIVTEEKCYGFISYQAHRGKTLKENYKSTSDPSVIRFDKEDFDRVMSKIQSFDQSITGWAHYGEVLGFQQVNHYLCAIKEIMANQRDNQQTTLRNEDLMTERLTKLLQMVISRKDKVDKALYKERTTSEFAPYKVAPEISRIEYYMWHYNNSSSLASCASSLRDRYHYLAILQGVLRSESMYLADLSDLTDFKFQQKLEPDPYHVTVLSIGRGKTNQAKTIFGRMMRHRDPRLCSVGGLGLYLLARFQTTNEIDDIFDFTTNKTWFNTKLLRNMQKCKKIAVVCTCVMCCCINVVC